jgi:hypothetical protein
MPEPKYSHVTAKGAKKMREFFLRNPAMIHRGRTGALSCYAIST